MVLKIAGEKTPQPILTSSAGINSGEAARPVTGYDIEVGSGRQAA
jgi:hypothetical protein